MPERILITGPAGCGSTKLLLEKVVARIKSGRMRESVVIVPNYEHLERLEIRLIEEFNINGITEDLFATPDRLAKRLNPGAYRNVASMSYMNLLLKEILLKSEFGLFKEGLKTGFRRRLAELFHEFRLIHPSKREDLFKFLEAEYPDGVSGRNLVVKSIQVFRAIESELVKRNLYAPENARFKAGEIMSAGGTSAPQRKESLAGETPAPQGKTGSAGETPTLQKEDFNQVDLPGFVYICGFDDIEEPHLAILLPLINHAEEAVVTLPGGDEWQFKQSVDLRQMFLEIGFRETKLPCSTRYKNDSLINLEKALRTGKESDLSDDLSMFMADDNRDEADFIARRARTMIQDGVKPEEILIIHPSPVSNFINYESAFDRMGVPVKLTVKRFLKELSPSRDLLAVLSLIAGRYDDAASLSISRYAEQIGKLYSQTDKHTIGSLVDGTDIEKPSKIDLKSWNLLKDLVKKSKAIAKIGEFENFVKYVVSKTIFLPVDMQADPAKFSSNSWGSLYSILHELASFYETEKQSLPVTFEQFLDDLIIESGGIQVQPRDRRRSAVVFAGFEESRLKEARVVFLAGMNDLNFPPKVSTDPILGESVRQILVSKGYRFKTSSNEQERNRYLLYAALTRAKEKLIVTYPTMDERGETMEISSPLAEIFPGGAMKDSKERTIFTWDDLVTETAFHMGDQKESDFKLLVLEKLKSHYARGFRVLTRNPEFEIPSLEYISRKTSDKAYNASALENYARCPFIYFARSILNLPEAETGIEKTLNPLVRGIAIHQYLATTLGHEHESVDLRKILEEQGINLDELDFVEDGYVNDLVTVLDEFVLREKARIRNRIVEIACTEFPFGMAPSQPMKIQLEIGERIFMGRIDRIDNLPDGTVAVYDYKTMSNTRKVKEKYDEATRFQLPLYAIALKAMGMNPSTVGIIAIGRNGVLVKPDEDDKDFANVESLTQSGIKAISEVISKIEAGEFPLEPLDKDECGWDKCGYYHICRIIR